MEVKNDYDIIIIGAGATGLMAAYELCKAGKKVAIIEARNRVGGRIYSIYNPELSIYAELGAEFIHGHLPVTLSLLKKAHIPYYKVHGSFWRMENGQLRPSADFIENYDELLKKLNLLKEDISVAAFLQTCLNEDRFSQTKASLKSYVEGYDAADIYRASTFALRNELSSSDGVQYRMEGGYQRLISYLYNSGTQYGCNIFLSNIVTHIQWQNNKVIVTANEKQYTAAKAIITVPLGMLQTDSKSKSHISFAPALTEKINAAKQLGFGNVIKILLQFDNCFWKNDITEQMSFLFSTKEIPTWWTQYPLNIPLLTGWLAGPKAALLKAASEEEIVQKAIVSLSEIFIIPSAQLHQKLKTYYIANWVTDPYCQGGYAYETVNANHYRQILKQPVDNTLFFAGEALHNGPEIGTVEAALCSGKEAVAKLLAHL